MAIELKEVFETLGLKPDDIKTIEDFKTNVDNTFTRNTLINEDSEPVKKILGKLYGTLENEIKKVAKANELDVDFDTEALKGKKVKEKIDFVFKSLSEKNKLVIDDLTAKVGLGNDDKVKEWEKKFEKSSQKSKDLQALLDATTNEYNSFKETASSQIKGVKLDVLKKDAFSKVNLRDDASNIEKRGYNTIVDEEVNFDLDENEQLIGFNKKGERYASTKVTGTFKTVHEILEEIAIRTKLYKLNPDGGKPKPAITFGQTTQPQSNGVKSRPIAPRMT